MAAELIGVKCHTDDRGFLYQIYGDFPEKFPDVKRIYVVGNFCKGIIRGFHMHKKEHKSYFVVNGAAKFVVVDEKKKAYSYVLTSRDSSVLIVPPKHYHGWVSLEDNTVLIGLSDKSLDESLKDDFRMDPFSFGKELWEVKPR